MYTHCTSSQPIQGLGGSPLVRRQFVRAAADDGQQMSKGRATCPGNMGFVIFAPVKLSLQKVEAATLICIAA